MMLVDHALERTLVAAIVAAPSLLAEVPSDFGLDALGDLQAQAVWTAVANLDARRAPIHIESVRAELEKWAGHRELAWFERPSESWPRAFVDIVDLCAERLATDPTCFPITAWCHALQRLAAKRRPLIELDEDIDVAALERKAS